MQIVARAMGIILDRVPNAKISRQAAVADILMVHANGCPLDLQNWLDANDVLFMRNFWGIRDTIDRDTGRLRGNFIPTFKAV